MTSSHKEFMEHFGWNDFFENQMASLTDIGTNTRPARVINEEKNLYRLQFSLDEVSLGSVTGKKLYEARSREDFPAVGDWVLADIPEGSERAVIRHIFKRKSALLRKQIGASSDVQILSTNVDTVFITTSLNADLNYARLERYLTFAWDSGAQPVILLTKADLCEDAETLTEEVRERFIGIDVFSLAAGTYHEAEFLQEYLKWGRTVVIVGSSGVGKSTLANYLIGEDVITTQEIREDDAKGKHTTTSRSLYVSRYGGLIIDTPGMRELQFADHEEGLQTQFADIEELILNCRFRNCSHQAETGCAIVNALENNFLLPEHWKSYKKIQAEIRHNARKMDKVLLAQDRKQWKKRNIEYRQKFKHSGLG